MSKLPRLSLALFVLFVLSGFAGLIYQSVWSNYLGLTLGHAAYAQTLVLSIFMGGMAVGAWLASRYSIGWKRLILGYAVLEAAIGLLGLVFHPLFVAYTGFSQETVLPALGSAPLAHGYQWISAALLIAPQSVLLGATFPLMSAGLIRALPDEHAEVLGGLYFSNSLGAALGALVATFLLLPIVGLPGSVFTAGLLNLVVALGAWLVSKLLDESSHSGLPPAVKLPIGKSEEGPAEVRSLGRILMWSTAISGAASFVYEVGWVRLLNQALGATIHSFELMLAAFILGLAFGGLWIRKRARSLAEPVRYVGHVQVWMAVAALLSIPMFTQSFRFVGWMMEALARTEHGYTLFELGTALIALIVMFPTAFLAGMTLPLFTLALLRQGAGERAIGRIYAANTLGAIAGVALIMHVLIPLIGVRMSVTLAAIVDGLVGLYLLRMVNPARMSRPVAGVALAMAAAIAFSLVLGKPDPLEQIGGVYRSGVARNDGAAVEYLRDGKTATVASFTTDGRLKTISTNGKPDASLSRMEDAPSVDEVTMVMMGSLPLILHPEPKDIAVIGWGSGLTTHTLLGSDVPASVDTIEIEAAMVEGAKVFGPRVARAYTDPRSHIRIDDARTFFATGARRYDVIISEPSNPWVSGVASLFTQEFYGFLKGHLKSGGMVVQWLHSYEISDPLFATMVGAILVEFPNTDLYVTNTSDLLMVARTGPTRALPNRMPFPEDSALLSELRRVGLDRPEQIALRHIGGENVLRNYVSVVGAVPHSDYFPIVSLNAPRTRFMHNSAQLIDATLAAGLPILDILDCRVPVGDAAGLPNTAGSSVSQWQQMALTRIGWVVHGAAGTRSMRYSPTAFDDAQALRANSAQLADSLYLMPRWTELVASFAAQTIGFLPAEDLEEAWISPTWLPVEARALPDIEAIMAAYSATARRDVKEMRQFAETVLGNPADRQSPRLREQMLSIAMLGALGMGDHAAAQALEAKYARGLPDTASRRYILGWARGNTPACRARQH